MSLEFIKKIIHNRTIITAIANAIVTWVILIIAPLGLFAVIICTIGVFLSSLVIGNLSDRALLFLVGNGDRQSLDPTSTATLESSNHPERSENQHHSTSDIKNSLIQEQIKKLLK